MTTIGDGKRVSPPDDLVSDIYIDESSQTKNRYLLLGGLIIPTMTIGLTDAVLMKARLPDLPHGEMKWGKVSTSKLKAYRRFADSFFDATEFRGVHFHSLVVDTSGIDDAKFNDGSKDIGFNKEVYQLARKFARLYPERYFHLYPDQRQTSQMPSNLRDILNAGSAKSGDGRQWPFRRCQFRDSGQTLSIQLVDILLGALAFQINGHAAKEGSSEAKCRLSAHILQRAGVQRPLIDTRMTGKFTVWHRNLKPRGGVPRS